MGLLLLETNHCNLIYEFNKGTTLRVKVMKTKKKPKKAVIQPLKVVLVEQGSTIITQIYRSRESCRLNGKARYDKIVARIIERLEPHYGHSETGRIPRSGMDYSNSVCQGGK